MILLTLALVDPIINDNNRRPKYYADCWKEEAGGRQGRMEDPSSIHRQARFEDPIHQMVRGGGREAGTRILRLYVIRSVSYSQYRYASHRIQNNIMTSLRHRIGKKMLVETTRQSKRRATTSSMIVDVGHHHQASSHSTIVSDTKTNYRYSYADLGRLHHS